MSWRRQKGIASVDSMGRQKRASQRLPDDVRKAGQWGRASEILRKYEVVDKHEEEKEASREKKG